LLEQPVATVSFESSEPQHFVAIVVGRNGKEQRFNLNGDQWQLDTRLIKWRGLLSALDIKPGYRLDRLSGRFYDIQKETAENRTSYSIINSLLALDVWRCMHNHANWFPVADTSYGSATYLPMKKGALYEIYLSNIGLVARPLNDVAKKAVDEWH